MNLHSINQSINQLFLMCGEKLTESTRTEVKQTNRKKLHVYSYFEKLSTLCTAPKENWQK